MAEDNQGKKELEVTSNEDVDSASMDETRKMSPDNPPASNLDETQRVNAGMDETQVFDSDFDEIEKTESESDAGKSTESPSASSEDAKEEREAMQESLGTPPPNPPNIGVEEGQEGSKRPAWWMITLIGIVIIVLIAGISAVAGYASGIKVRKNAQSTLVVQELQEQYQLGLQDMGLGNYDRARQRFEYILQNDPSFPEVTDKLAEVMLYLNTTATPTLVPTPTLTPTPDLRSEEELFNQAQEYILNEDWQNALDICLQLRKLDPTYQDVAVDGMVFLSLRNLGVKKILNADLEGGMYDLTLAKKYGVLDIEAEALYNWASLYVTGASFWELDWGQAAYYFGQVAPHAPNLRDGTGLTAIERYLTALVKYAQYLENQKDWCGAQKQYEAYLALSHNAEVEKALAVAINKCEKSQKKGK